MKDHGPFAAGTSVGIMVGLLLGLFIGFAVLPAVTWMLPDGPFDFLNDLQRVMWEILPSPPHPHGPAPC